MGQYIKSVFDLPSSVGVPNTPFIAALFRVSIIIFKYILLPSLTNHDSDFFKKIILGWVWNILSGQLSSEIKFLYCFSIQTWAMDYGIFG